MKEYESACAVNTNTKNCQGPEEKCRRALVFILGTELRTKCACEGEAADFRQLYDCYGWRRLLWANPCVGNVLYPIFPLPPTRLLTFLFQMRLASSI